MKRFILLFFCVFLAGICPAQSPQELTVSWIYTHSATGHPPETVKWSPDGVRVSFLLPDAGEKANLYAIDAATGKQSVLVPAEKIAAMTPAASQTKDDRQRDNRARYNVVGYHWAPDSRHLLFDANGQLWLYSLESASSTPMTAPGDSVGDPKFSPDGRKLAFIRDHNLYVRPVGEGAAMALTSEKDENILNGEVDWVYAEELDVRSNYFWSPDSSRIVFLQMNEAKVPTYPITDFNLHGHLLDVHGTSDDNVHMQNTIQMVNALINAGKKFELMLYPRKTHGIGGSQARIDLFTRIREHLDRDLPGAETAKTE